MILIVKVWYVAILLSCIYIKRYIWNAPQVHVDLHISLTMITTRVCYMLTKIKNKFDNNKKAFLSSFQWDPEFRKLLE